MDALLARLGIRSLQSKLLVGTLLVTCFVMTAVMIVVERRQRVAIIDEVERRGGVLARNLAAISSNPLLLYNFVGLEQIVTRVAGEADVVYAIVLDADGKVAAHSGHPERVGSALDGPVAERAASAPHPLTQEASTPDGGALYDFTVPIEVAGQTWGRARVGLSKRRMEAEIRKTRWELGVLTVFSLMLGCGVAALVAQRIAKPVRQLAEGAVLIARGELNQRIDASGFDEIGRLSRAFNEMAVEVFEQRTALEEAHAQLKSRFEELADLKSYTDSILTSLVTGVVTVDLEGRVVTLNPAAELLTGFFSGEAARRYCTEVFAHTDELGEALMETLASRAPILSLPATLRRRNGSTVPIELSTAPLKGGDGKHLGAVAVLRDLSLVRDLEGQLRRSDRLAALGTLAAGLAHEIKNPLTSLLTFTRHLGRRFDDEHFREKFQDVVPRELERINTIVERLLELARPARLTFRSVRVAPLLNRVVDLYAAEIDAKHVRVRREYAADVPSLRADPEALYRAFVNLVANGLDAMEPGGQLTLRVGWSEGGRLRRRGAGQRVRVEIEDTGRGIESAEVDRIFNPFFTTKPGGTGLGLALTHKIVEDHGGTIDFQTAPRVGTTFRIVLPLVPPEPSDDTDVVQPRGRS